MDSISNAIQNKVLSVTSFTVHQKPFLMTCTFYIWNVAIVKTI